MTLVTLVLLQAVAMITIPGHNTLAQVYFVIIDYREGEEIGLQDITLLTIFIHISIYIHWGIN